MKKLTPLTTWTVGVGSGLPGVKVPVMPVVSLIVALPG